MAVFDENRVAFFWREEKEMALGDRSGTKEISYFVNFEEKTGGVVEIRRGKNVINDRLLGRRLLKRVISTRSRGYFVDIEILNILDDMHAMGVFGVLIVWSMFGIIFRVINCKPGED